MIIRTGSKTTGVRREYSHESIWRDALGPSRPLYVFAVYGESIDAPECMPAGGMRDYGMHGNGQSVAHRGD